MLRQARLAGLLQIALKISAKFRMGWTCPAPVPDLSRTFPHDKKIQDDGEKNLAGVGQVYDDGDLAGAKMNVALGQVHDDQKIDDDGEKEIAGAKMNVESGQVHDDQDDGKKNKKRNVATGKVHDDVNLKTPSCKRKLKEDQVETPDAKRNQAFPVSFARLHVPEVHACMTGHIVTVPCLCRVRSSGLHTCRSELDLYIVVNTLHLHAGCLDGSASYRATWHYEEDAAVQRGPLHCLVLYVCT